MLMEQIPPGGKQEPPQVIRLGQIVIKPGRNPRKHFDEAEMQELENSIRAQGVIQPVLVRPIGDGMYELVAGERRVRASRKVFGENGETPALVKDIPEAVADAIALIENTVRADMSVAEEADAAGKLLVLFNGDKHAVARELGWPMKKLLRRLGLLVLAPEVSQALTERQISISHAELLAALPANMQATALGRIVEHKVSASTLREQIGRISVHLSRAVFDKEAAGCAACQFNTSVQQSTFEEAVDEGHCTNRSCFDGKTTERIEAIKDGYAGTVGTVRFLDASADSNYIKLQAEGALGVGDAQYAGCKACERFGCTISQEGAVEEDICFDIVCNRSKIMARLKAEKGGSQDKPSKRAGKQEPPAGKDRAGEPSRAVPPGAASSGPASSEKTAAQPSGNPKPAPTSGGLSMAVKDYRKGVWEDVAAKELRNRPGTARDFLIALALSGNASKINAGLMREAFKRLADEAPKNELTGAFKGVEDLAGTYREDLLTEAAVSAVKFIAEHDLRRVLGFLDAALAKHWRIGEEFLKLLTKGEIEGLCQEIGLKAHLGKQFGKVMGVKKPEVIVALLGAEGFHFEGVIPKVMDYRQSGGRNA